MSTKEHFFLTNQQFSSTNQQFNPQREPESDKQESMSLSASLLASRRPEPPPIRAPSDPTPSAPANNTYPEIDPQTLFTIPSEDIEEFRDYLRTIPFRYNDPAPSVLGRHLMTEADARLFFDSSILLAVWPVALAMVPTVRDADMVLTCENRYQGVNASRPDTSIILYDGNRNVGTVALVENKGPQALRAFRSVVRAESEGIIIATPNDWDTVTRQLRKNTKEIGCQHILCSDESDAYLFYFPSDESSEEVGFLHASNDGTGTLTLREAILFLIYSGIRETSKFTLRGFSERSSIRNPGDYKDMFRPPPAPQSAAPSRKQPKRQVAQRTQRGDVIVVSTSTDHVSLFQTADKTLKIYRQIHMEVDEVFSENVVKCIPLDSTDLGTIVLKFFPADNARMLSEILAYKALQRIQGLVVPEFIGVFAIEGFKEYALGLSAVDGVTLREYFETNVPTMELFRSVLFQIRAIHNCGVAHMDVREENILIKRDQSAVVIDFDLSLLNPVKTGFKIDQEGLIRIFSRRGLDEQAALIAAGVQPRLYKFPVGPSIFKRRRQDDTG